MVTGDLDSSVSWLRETMILVFLEVPMVTGDLDSSVSRGSYGYGRFIFCQNASNQHQIILFHVSTCTVFAI